jgi:hypothetical protein
MTQILARLAALNLLALLAAFTAGLISFFSGGLTRLDLPWWELHFYLGLGSTLLTLGVHCLVFVYFLGTGRWVKEVALAYGIPDDPLPKLTRQLKRWTYPVALAAMLLPIAAALAGAKVQGREWHWSIHFTLGLATLLVNAWAFVVEYRNVKINAEVLDRVLAEVDRIRAEYGLPSNAEALAEEERTNQAQKEGKSEKDKDRRPV